MPALIAVDLTGPGRILRPRPEGRSGWQYTATRLTNDDLRRAFSEGTAKSGVPAKTTRIEGGNRLLGYS